MRHSVSQRRAGNGGGRQYPNVAGSGDADGRPGDGVHIQVQIAPTAVGYVRHPL